MIFDQKTTRKNDKITKTISLSFGFFFFSIRRSYDSIRSTDRRLKSKRTNYSEQLIQLPLSN